MLTPTYLIHTITDLSPARLAEDGFVGLLLDVDNTLTLHHSQEVPPAVSEWLEAAKAAGLQPILVSNAKEKRVAPFAATLGLPYISLACKPLPGGYLRAIRSLGLSKTACLAIGDQSFTDVLGAKLAGIRIAQTEPFQPETGWSFRVRRYLETGIRRRAKIALEKENSL